MRAPAFKDGQEVHYINGNGLYLGIRTIVSVDTDVIEMPGIESEFRYFITPTDTPWYSIKESQLTAKGE